MRSTQHLKRKQLSHKYSYKSSYHNVFFEIRGWSLVSRNHCRWQTKFALHLHAVSFPSSVCEQLLQVRPWALVIRYFFGIFNEFKVSNLHVHNAKDISSLITLKYTFTRRARTNSSPETGLFSRSKYKGFYWPVHDQLFLLDTQMLVKDLNINLIQIVQVLSNECDF